MNSLIVFFFCLFPYSKVENKTNAVTYLPSHAFQQLELKDTVNHPKMITSKHDGMLRLSAETGRTFGSEIKYMPEWKAFGWFKQYNRVTWDVKVKKEGEYDVYLEWSVSDEAAGKPFVLEAGDQQLHGHVGKTGAWETFRKEKIGNILLAAGKQKITFRPDPKFEKDFGKSSLMDLRELTLVLINPF